MRIRARSRCGRPLLVLTLSAVLASCVSATAAADSRLFACLSRHGPLITLSGTLTDAYHDEALVLGTRIDARAAVFLASPTNRYPTELDGDGRFCLAGGDIRGQYDRTLSWAEMHDMNNAGVVVKSPTTIDGIRIDDVTDGVRPEGIGRFVVRHAHLSYVRDDCVENDHLEGGVIDGVLFDGCYVGISERPTQAIIDAGFDGRNHLLRIRRSLIRLQPMPGPRDGASSDLGNGGFFKWDELATKLSLHDNTFMAEQVSQDGPESMGIPGRLVSCKNNTMVWLGPGDYPAPLPSCFRVTRDRSVWDAAVAGWKSLYPDVAD